MSAKKFTRRDAIITTGAGALGVMVIPPLKAFSNKQSSKLAILGGEKVHSGDWPEWPVWDKKAEKEITEMLDELEKTHPSLKISEIY